MTTVFTKCTRQNSQQRSQTHNFKMAEHQIFNDLIKLEMDDNEDFIVYNILEGAEDLFDKYDDPLLSLTPVVYTTKIDDMKIIRQNLTNLKAKDILKEIHSESRPTVQTENINCASSSSVESFVKLASVISNINAKARLQSKTLKSNLTIKFSHENAKTLPIKTNSPNVCKSSSVTTDPPILSNTSQTGSLPIPDISSKTNKHQNTSNFENVESISEIHSFISDVKTEPEIFANAKTPDCKISFSDNTKSNFNTKKEYWPCFVVLEDIKGLLSANQTTVRLPLIPHAVKQSANIDANNEKISEIKIEREENHRDDIKILTENVSSQPENENTFEIFILGSDATTSTCQLNSLSKESHIQNTETAKVPAENSETKERSSNKPKRKRKSRIYYDMSSDEDYEPIIELNKKSKIKKVAPSEPVKTMPPKAKPDKISKTNNAPSSGSVTIVMADPSQIPFQEKYALIVLMDERRIAYVYRVNPTKLVTDFYITKQCDEYKLASMYPKEEKIIEQYCCWYKREEIIGKICTRKNYPFTIQKFLKQPHTCHDEECNCCCRPSKTNSRQNNQERRCALNKSLKVSDEWINELLNKSKTTTGLISKALSYTKKVTSEKPVEKQPEKYLENYLLCLKNRHKKTSPDDNVETTYELYEIGQYGNIIRTLLSQNEDEVAVIRKRYQLKGMPIRDAEVCCWMKREKLMHELKRLKSSPDTLKHILVAHSCEYKKCSCCCKPLSASLGATIKWPSTFHQTTAYEKNMRKLTIKFSAKSKNAMLKASDNYLLSKKNTKTTDASTAAVVLSDSATKNDNQGLGVNILSKFKDLKLGVNSTGQLEVALNEPAKNLSVSELKVLSEILEFSTKQTIELGLTTEEFCNRINSKSRDIIRVTAPDTTLICTENSTPSPLEDTNDDVFMDVEEEDNTATVLCDQATLTDESIPIQSPKLPSQTKRTEPTIKNIPLTAKPNIGKINSNIFTSLSNLLETKSKNYVSSFKSFFNISISPDICVTNFKKFATVCMPSKPSNEFIVNTMPVIKETFTLAKSSPEVPVPIPGPSGVSRERGTKLNAGAYNNPEEAQNDQIRRTSNRSNITKRKIENVSAQVEKKIRVKPPSELNAPIFNATSMSNDVDELNWPGPITLKLEPHTNIQQIVTPMASVNSNSYPQTYVPPNVKIVSPTPITVKKLYQLNGNPVQIAQNTSNGIRYMTLAPLNAGDGKKTAVSKIVQSPQVPPLVPISVSASPMSQTPEASDIENSIPCQFISK